MELRLGLARTRRFGRGWTEVDPNADQFLRASGLPTARTWRLSEVDDLGMLPGTVYVRAPTPQRSPGPMTLTQLRQLASQQDVSTMLVTEFIESTAGAAYVSCGSYELVEIVEGHLSGLLTSGLVRARYLLSDNGEVLCSQEFEQSMCAGPDGRIELNRSDAAQLDTRTIALAIHDKVGRSRAERATLMEILVTPSRTVWVDAKSYPWDVKLDAVFEANRRLIYGSPTAQVVEPRAWSVDSIPGDIAGRAITLREHALLSHFVTYSLIRGLGGIWNHD